MLILQAGVPKSGNLWLYRILQSIFRSSGGFEQKSFIQAQPVYRQPRKGTSGFTDEAEIDFLEIERARCYFRFQTVHREPIWNIDDYLRQCSHVWTHSGISKRSFAVLPKFDKIVYLIRDPRDSAISLSRFVFTPHVTSTYPQHERDPDSYLAHHLDGMLRHWVRHVGGYLKNRDDFRIHIVFYERLLHSFEEEQHDLLAYLGIKLGDGAIGEIRSEVDFLAMKEKDPFHVRRGTSGQWQEVLTREQKSLAGRLSAKMLRLLGYPVVEGERPSLPCLSAAASAEQIDDAVSEARRTLRDQVERVHWLVMSDRPLLAKVSRVRNWLR